MQQDAQGFYDIYGTIHVPFWQTVLFYRTALALVCAVVGLLCFFVGRSLWQRYWEHKKTVHDDVLAQLATLHNRAATVQSVDDISAIYSHLIVQFKRILAHHHGVHVHSCTDDELYEMISLDDEYNEWHNHFNVILERAKMTKFARISDTRLTAVDDVSKIIAYVTFHKLRFSNNRTK